MQETESVPQATAQDPGPATVEEGLGGGEPPPTAAAEFSRPVAGRLARATFAAVTLMLFGSAALAASLQHACALGLRVDGLHVSAPEGADSAEMMIDAGLERPGWTPHRAWLQSAACQVRLHHLDVAVEAPEAQHQGPSRVKLHARMRVASAGAAAPAPGCEVTSSVDLFGSGVRVPWTAWMPVDVWAAKAPKMWMHRAGSLTRKGSWSLKDPNVTVEQPALVGWRVPVGTLPEPLHSLLGHARISLDAAVAYEESGDRSVRLTQAVNASLNIESDGEGGYLVSAPARVSGHVRPAAFAAALGKLLFGDSRGERGGVHRSVRLAAVAPSSPAAQCLGVSHAVGWHSRQKSGVHDLARGARRLLGRRLARSLPGAAGQRLWQQPPQDGRRLSSGWSSVMTLSEMVYVDETQIDIDLTATLTDTGIDFDFAYGSDGETMFQVNLTAAESAEAGDASLDLKATWGDVEVANIDFSWTEATEATSLSMLIKVPDSGQTIADVSASSSASAGESLLVKVYDPSSGTEFITITGSNSSASGSLSAQVKDPSNVATTIVDVSASATYTGDDTEGDFTVTVTAGDDVVVSGTVTDDYRTEDGFSLDAQLSIGGSTVGRVDVDGTHDDLGLSAVATVTDDSSQQLFKLDPLVWAHKSTNYTVYATVFVSDEEIATFGVSLTNEPTSGQVQDVDINLFSPIDSNLNLTLNVSLANSIDGMEQIPCIQGSCSVDVGVHSQHVELIYSSMTSAQQEDYRAALGLTASDTLYFAGASVAVQGVTMLEADVQLSNGNSAITADEFSLASTGTVKTTADEKIIGWDMGSDVSSSSQSLDLTVTDASSTILEVDIAFTELSAENSSAGEIKMGSYSLVKWDFASSLSGSTETVDMDLWFLDAEVFALDATSTTDPTTTVSFASVEVAMENGLEPIGGVQLITLDAAGDQASAQLQVFESDLTTPFFQLDAVIVFTAASGVRLLTDFDGSVQAQVWTPGDTDAGAIMDMLVNCSSSGGEFTSQMFVNNEQMFGSIVGTSGTDSITIQDSIDGMAMTVALSKPDGLLDTMTEMDFTLTLEASLTPAPTPSLTPAPTPALTQSSGQEDDGDSDLDLDDISISVSIGYDGTGTWDVTGSVSESGDAMASVEVHLHEEWVSMTSLVQEDIGDMIGTGAFYEYANFSIPTTSDSSDMWEINYFQTSDLIETTNVTWHTDANTGVSSLSVASYVMQMSDNGEWQYLFSLNATRDETSPPDTSTETSAAATPAPPATTEITVSATFKLTVAASEAQDFISNSDVQESFVKSIAGRVGVQESLVEVTLSVVSDSGRRLSSDQAEILVEYSITTQVGDSNDAGVISESDLTNIVDTLANTAAEDFVEDFTVELQTTSSASSFSAVEAVPDSATTPTTEATGVPPSINSGAQAAFPQALLPFPQALLLATVCRLTL